MFRPQKARNPGRDQIARPRSRTAPVKGWNTRDPEANMAEGYAMYLENWWPTPREVQLRKGAADHVTGISGNVYTLMNWSGPAADHKLFAATNSGIYDVTTAGVVGASVSTITNGKCQYTSYVTSGKTYLFVVNGSDSLRYYDGTSWTTVANFSISGGGTLTTSNIINIHVFKRALYFIEKDSMNFYYLPIDAIGGSVGKYPLGGLFDKGGYLNAGGTWSVDGGQGVDDYCVFGTSEGQLVLFYGSDPSSAATWAQKGVYYVGEPLGRKCFSKFGGDLLYMSQLGLLPLSRALQSTTINLQASISDAIGSTFSQAAADYDSNYGWQLTISPRDNMLVANIPTADSSTSEQYVMNTITGAWARFTGWDAFCWELSDKSFYVGMNGKVAKVWTGTDDFGGTISAYAKDAFFYPAGGRTTSVKMVRPILKIQGTTAVNIAVDVDFADGTDYGPASFQGADGSLWDIALWGDDDSMLASPGIWGGDQSLQLDWLDPGCAEGYTAAIRLRAIGKGATIAWSATDFAVEGGGIL
ncbi:phage stabilization protein [Bacteriophage sp.]|nr:phage stabilization protein [Bacteriophage sp.]